MTLRTAAWGTFVVCLLGLIGHWTRGRSIPLEMLLYIPLVPLGGLALLLGLATLRLLSRREGAMITLIGLVSVLVAGSWMVGRGPAAEPTDAGSRGVVRLLHWNVLWGGFNAAQGGWRSIVDEVVSQSPDLIVLSEAPSEAMRHRLLDRLGKDWREASVASPPPHTGYRYQIAILSRWPTRIVSMPVVSNGTAVEAIVDHPSRPIRILAIDGKSPPTIPRSPMLGQIESILNRSAQSATGAIDLVVGDFNCVGRTRGFDELRAGGEGYSLASEAAIGWRATWPSWFPVYDIDHIWVRKVIAIRSCRLFSRLASDHRGQLAELLIEREP